MDAAQAKPCHENMNRESQVRQLATVRVSPTDETSKVNTQAQVGSFEMASRYITRLGVSASDTWDCSRNPASGSKPIRPRNVGAGIEFNQSGKINFASERFLDRIHVRPESVRCK